MQLRVGAMWCTEGGCYAVHLQPADGWSYWRWDGAAHAVEDADKWCCWTWPSDADPQTVLPDWLHNVAAQQYCAGPVLAT